MDMDKINTALAVIHAEVEQAARAPSLINTRDLQYLSEDLRNLAAVANGATSAPNPTLRPVVAHLCQYLDAHPFPEPTSAAAINRAAQRYFGRARGFATMDLKQALLLSGYRDLVSPAGTVWYQIPEVRYS